MEVNNQDENNIGAKVLQRTIVSEWAPLYYFETHQGKKRRKILLVRNALWPDHMQAYTEC